MTTITPVNEHERELSESNLVLICYVLYGCGLIIPTLIPAIIALIINYIKIDDMHSDIWRSHFRWQLRTFWYSVLWFFLSIPLIFFFGLGILLMNLVIPVWVIYRVVKGLLWWNDHRGFYQMTDYR